MRRILFSLALAIALTLVGTGLALAATGAVIPHGGFSSSTDACLQCHDIHEAGESAAPAGGSALSDYVLMRYVTVADTCGTCHNLYQTQVGIPGTVYFDPGYPGTEVVVPQDTNPGTGAPYTAYQVPAADAAIHEGHRMGVKLSGAITYSDGTVKTAPSNYIPGSTHELTAIDSWAQGFIVESAKEPPPAGEGYDGTAGLYCAGCHTPHGDYQQGSYPNQGYGWSIPYTTIPKLLSSRPNHVTIANMNMDGTGKDLDEMTNWNTEGRYWCLKCHDKRRSNPDGYNSGGQDDNTDPHYNHPEQFCLTCHGNYQGSQASQTYDFPHTGVTNVLSMYPDELCVFSCHGPGTLP